MKILNTSYHSFNLVLWVSVVQYRFITQQRPLLCLGVLMLMKIDIVRVLDVPKLMNKEDVVILRIKQKEVGVVFQEMTKKKKQKKKNI